MKALRISMIFILIITYILLFPVPSGACSCVEPPSVQDELDRSSAVFRGEVMEIKDADYTKKVLFQVKEIWKGIEQSQVILLTAESGSSCGFNFNVGQEYVVYATGEGSLSTSICDRTVSVQSLKVEEDLEALGQGVSPVEIVDLTKEMNKLPIALEVGLWVGGGIFVLLLLLALTQLKKRLP
jgi:hypothetical protein